tara:strand:+ start:5258 stop:5863 length:606 start_codon:yes stop_codon:yes gene_type:complete
MKIFNLGMSKTGTTSFYYLMQKLYIKSYHDISISDHSVDELKKEFTLMDCYSGALSHRYKDIYTAFPDAKYVLTIRDELGWLKSARKQFTYEDHNFSKFRNYIFGTTKVWELSDKDMLDSYNKINTEIIDFFKNKENFMVLNFINSTDRDKLMKELLKFLDIRVISNVLSTRIWGNSVKLFPDENVEISNNIKFPQKNKSK